MYYGIESKLSNNFGAKTRNVESILCMRGWLFGQDFRNSGVHSILPCVRDRYVL